MKNVLHKEWWNSGTNLAHLEPPPIPLIRKTYNGKSDGYFVKLKHFSNPMSSISDLYEFKIYLFDHDNPEGFLLFLRNFNMALTATGAMGVDAKIQYLCKLVHVEALRRFDLLSADVENTKTLNVDYYKRFSVVFFSLWIRFQNKSV